MRLPVPAQAALTGAVFVFVEALLLPGGGLTPAPSPIVVAVAAVALATLHAVFAWLARGLGAHAVAVPVVLWAFVWGPDQARLRGAPPGTGYLAPVVLGLVARWQPGVAAGLSLVGALPTSRPPSPPDGGPKGTDIVLVTVDTVRASVDLAGPAIARSPERWRVYSTAIAPAPWTPPSVHSIMLGWPPDEHGAGGSVQGGVSGRGLAGPSLPEELAAIGYVTQAFVTNPHLRADAGFAKGFTVWMHDRNTRLPLTLWHHADGLLRRLGSDVDTLATSRDARVTTAAVRSLEEWSGEARFTWIHLLGPHEYRRHAATPDERLAAYDALARTAAGQVARIATAAPHATLIVTSDHGELLGEGGRWGHGHELAEELLRVPLAIRSAAPAGREDAPVALVDLRSEILEDAAAPMLIGRGRVRVGGVRGEPERAGVWTPDGVVPEPARRVPAGSALTPDARTTRALQVLGYVDP